MPYPANDPNLRLRARRRNWMAAAMLSSALSLVAFLVLPYAEPADRQLGDDTLLRILPGLARFDHISYAVWLIAAGAAVVFILALRQNTSKNVTRRSFAALAGLSALLLTANGLLPFLSLHGHYMLHDYLTYHPAPQLLPSVPLHIGQLQVGSYASYATPYVDEFPPLQLAQLRVGYYLTEIGFVVAVVASLVAAAAVPGKSYTAPSLRNQP